jgi:hypothetical protein
MDASSVKFRHLRLWQPPFENRIKLQIKVSENHKIRSVSAKQLLLNEGSNKRRVQEFKSAAKS